MAMFNKKYNWVCDDYSEGSYLGKGEIIMEKVDLDVILYVDIVVLACHII